MKTLNKAVARYNGISLIVRILIGLIIGAVLALVAPGAGWVGELGSLFVGALKGIAPVLVFVIVASALAQGSSKLDRRFGTVIWLYMLTTFLAAAIAVVTSFMFPVTVVLADAAQSDVVPQGLGEVMGTLLTNFVANPVSALLNGNYIGILFWACLFGLAMKKYGADSTKLFLANTADAVSQIVRWIINLAPFGIMGLVYTNVSSNGLSIFTQYGRLLLLLVGTMLFMALVVSPFIIFVYLHCNPYPLVLRCLRESGLTAFFTRSSAANIPVNMDLCEKLGLDKDMYSVSIPLGATINMDGAAITITIMTLAVQLIVIILASFALGKLRPWGSGFIEILFLSGLFITSEMLTIPNFTTLKAWGLNGTRLALLLPYVTLGLPTATFIMINYVKGLPKELDEAALLDGCSLLQNLFRITLPLLKPVIATVMIFNFQGTWSEFYWALIEIKKDSLKTLPLGLMNFNSMYNTDYGVLCAGLCIATIPVVLLYLKCSSYFIGGMVAGAVKG